MTGHKCRAPTRDGIGGGARMHPRAPGFADEVSNSRGRFCRKTWGLWKRGVFRIVPMTLTPALKALYRFPRVRPNSGFNQRLICLKCI